MTDHRAALETALARAQEAIASANALVAAREGKPTPQQLGAELRALADVLTTRNDLAKAFADAQGIVLPEPEPDPVDVALYERGMVCAARYEAEGESPELHAECVEVIRAQLMRLHLRLAPTGTAH